MSIEQSLHDFISGLELTDNQVNEASRQHTFLRQQLQQRLQVQDNFLSGSYARNTAIRPLNDIDVFLVLDPRHHRRGAPRQTLAEVQQALDAAYPNKGQPTLQARSVNVAFSGTGMAYDVVPAFLERQDVYVIPDLRGDRWIPTNPRVHKERSTQANERAGKKLKPLTKAAKHWNYRVGRPLRSFHLEVMAWDVLTYRPASWADGLVALFEGLADRVLYACPDPAGLGPAISEGTDVGRARSALSEAARQARAARDAAARGQERQAVELLRGLFGGEVR